MIWIVRNMETIKLILFLGFIILGVSSNKKATFPIVFFTIAKIVRDVWDKQTAFNFK